MQPHDATGRDLSRQAATSDDFIPIKEVRAIFVAHKRPITERTLQRYCDKNYLSGQKRITAEGEKWFVLKSSVLTRIAEMEEFDKLRPAPTSDDVSEPVVVERVNDFKDDNRRQDVGENMSEPVGGLQQSQSTSNDMSRHVAAGRDTIDERETSARESATHIPNRERELTESIIKRLEIENEGLRKDKEKLYELLDAGNVEKRLLIESDRDTKAIAKNNNSLLAYFGQLFKGKDVIDAPPRDTSYRTQDLTDTLAGDERSV